MELNSRIFSNVLSPLAIYADATCSNGQSDCSGTTQNSSRDLLRSGQTLANGYSTTGTPKWRLDGIDTDGIRFFAVPSFAIDTPPLRVDVYLPPLEEHTAGVREILNPAAAMYTTHKSSAISLPISQHLLQALSHWSSSIPDFKELYLSLPFGSQIVVSEITPDPVTTSATIQLVHNYAVEQAMNPLDALQQMWPPFIRWPPTIDTTSLRLIAQIHEAITLVTIPFSSNPSRQYVFKSLLRNQKYLYNELKMLLTLPPHPNLVARPLYIVTHKCRFGGKRGVAGFILEYYPLGSVATHLSSRHQQDPTSPVHTPSLSDRFRWAKQITSALVHINNHGGFYPDLKPDNVVSRRSKKADGGRGHIDAVLLDLEQRGGWFSWSPPEVAYVEYLEILAGRGGPSSVLDDDNNNTVKEELTALIRGYIPDWTPSTQDERYTDATGGFSAPWLALARLRRDSGGALETLLERAQTFMLGKLLWCVFEGRAVVRCGIDHELLRDSDPHGEGFPSFRETPARVRRLIRACTAGAGEWDGRRRGIVLRGGRLVPADWDGEGKGPTAWETREVAKEWWLEEVQAAKEFLREITDVTVGRQPVEGGVLGMAMQRPLLTEVLAELTRIEEAGCPCATT